MLLLTRLNMRLSLLFTLAALKTLFLATLISVVIHLVCLFYTSQYDPLFAWHPVC